MAVYFFAILPLRSAIPSRILIPMSNKLTRLFSFLSLASVDAVPAPMVPGCVCVTRACACVGVVEFASLASVARDAAVTQVVETVRTVSGRSFVLSWEVK